MDDYELNERIEKTEYLVEADSAHSHFLWQEWADEARGMGYTSPYDKPSFKWKQHQGIMLEVGRIEDRPICITIMWNEIGGALIGFYNASSQLVDHKMVEEFLKKKFKDTPKTDTMNFAHVIGYLEKRKPNKVVRLEHAGRTIGLGMIEDYSKTGYLTTQLLQGHALEKSRRQYSPEKTDSTLDAVVAQIDQELNPLDEAVEEFGKTVWATWLKKHYRDQSYRGHEANAGNVNLMVWGIAGRVMVSLRVRDSDGEHAHITLIGADSVNDTDELAIQGILMKGATALQLVRDATRLSDDLSNDIRPNAEVGMG